MASLPSQAHVTRLEKRNQEVEKQNQELTWQIAMLAKDPEAPILPPKPQGQAVSNFQEAAGKDRPTLFSSTTANIGSLPLPKHATYQTGIALKMISECT